MNTRYELINQNSQTCEVNQELFTKMYTTNLKLDMPLTTSIIDGAIEFDGKEVFVCDDGKRYTWQEFWEKYKELKGDKLNENMDK